MILDIIQSTILIIVISLSIILGIGVLLVNNRSRINQFYFYTSVSIALWVLFGYLVYFNPLSSYVTFLGRANFAAVALFFVAIYGFVRNFPKERNLALIDKFFISSGITLSLLSFATPMVVNNITIKDGDRIWNFGSLEYLYYIYGIVFAGLVVYTIVAKSLKLTGDEKTRIKFLSLGIILVAVFNIIFNIVLPSFKPDLDIYWIGDYSLIFFLGFTAYAIVKYQLFNIKVIATETTVILLSIGLLIEIFLSNNFTEGLLKGVVWVLATYGGYILIKSVQTEIKQREKLEKLTVDLEEANKHLKELDETKDNFLSMASHELNTPIAAIEGYLSMICDEKMCGPLNEKASKYLNNVFMSSKRLAALVKDLLNVSRIESNRIHILYAEAHIEDIIDQAVAEIAIKAKNEGHLVVWQRPKKALPRTYADIARIIEVLINLLGNALKYTEPPGRIVIEAHTDGDKIVVSVTDNGRGIPADKADHIFEKFTQVDVLKDEVKGTGLGMFISKNLVELHKGKLWFKSSTDAESHGTTFYFSLPILKTKPFDKFEGQGSVITFK